MNTHDLDRLRHIAREHRVVSAGDVCPKCEEDTLANKSGVNGLFIGCNAYPRCRFTRNADGRAGSFTARETKKRPKPETMVTQFQELQELVGTLVERIETLEYYIDNSEILGEETMDEVYEECFASDGSGV